jgi:hypothetical protein
VSNSPSFINSVRQPAPSRTSDHRAWIASVLDDLDAIPDVDFSTIDHVPAVALSLSKRCSEASLRGFSPLSTAIARLVRALAATFFASQRVQAEQALTREAVLTLLDLSAQIRALTSDAFDEVLAAYFVCASAGSTHLAS